MIMDEKRIAQLWEREASRSELVAFVKEIAQLWEREASRSEVVAFVTELVNQNNRLFEKVKQLTLIRDRFCSRLENVITETRASGEDMGQTTVGTIEEDEPEALTLSSPISEVSNNGEKESSEVESERESEFAKMADSGNQTVEETTAVDSADTSAIPASSAEDPVLFEGEVEIAVKPPVNMAQLIRLRRNLHDVVHLKILRTDGSWKEGSVITTLVEKPLPLISMLTEMVEVEKAELCTDGDFPCEPAFEVKPGDWQGKRIVVTLNRLEVEQNDCE